MKRMMFAVFLFLTALQLNAQEEQKPVFTWSAYADIYYGYDFNKPEDHNRPSFLYSHNRANEFNLNLGYIKGNVTADRFRANLALATGTYINANYAAEPGVLKNIFEANAGLKLSGKENLWFDIGIMPSHIGFESAVSKDCWTLTRSLLAENSPYYETGAKLTYGSKNNQWLFSALVLNGWQKIKRVDGNNNLSFGTQIQYKPSSKLLINHSSFLGTDAPDSTGQYRIFQNLYSVFSIDDQWSMILGFDYGIQRKPKPEESWNQWYSPVAIVRYQPSPKWAGALRAEYYSDTKGVIIPVAVPGGFEVAGASLNIDYLPYSWMTMRLEARILQAQEPIFTREDVTTKSNVSICFSTAVVF